MGKTNVYVNGLALSSKKDGHNVRCTIPDICLTPPNNLPIPYLNFAKSKTLKKGTKKVKAGGKPCANRKSFYAKSKGDEPGKTGGIISKKTKSKATWIFNSPNVFLEGKPAARHTDKMFMNKMNTVSLGGNKNNKFEASNEVKQLVCADAAKSACSQRKKTDENGNETDEDLPRLTDGFDQDFKNGKLNPSILEAPAPKWYLQNGNYRGYFSRKLKQTSWHPKWCTIPDAKVKTSIGNAAVELKYCKDKTTPNQLRSRSTLDRGMPGGYHVLMVCLSCISKKKQADCERFKSSENSNYRKRNTDEDAIQKLKEKMANDENTANWSARKIEKFVEACSQAVATRF